MTDQITIPRALLEQALEALDNSVDVVYEEYTEAVQRYANIPGRKARLDGLAAMAKAHLDTSEAIRAELAKPTPTPAWHDAPTCAGVWHVKTHPISSPSSVIEVVVKEGVALFGFVGARWYGPIPQDGEKS